MLRNSSSVTTYKETMTLLNSKFEERGYTDIISQNTLIPYSQRAQHLTASMISKPDAIPIICTLDKERKFIQAVKDNWSIFSNQQDTRKKLYLKPILFSQKNHPNIQQKVTRSKIDYTITEHSTTVYQTPTFHKISYPAKNIKCRVSGCASCPQIQHSYQCTSYQTHKSYPISDIY